MKFIYYCFKLLIRLSRVTIYMLHIQFVLKSAQNSLNFSPLQVVLVHLPTRIFLHTN